MIDQIKSTVAEYLNVPMGVFTGNRGTRDKSEARQIAIYFVNKSLGGKPSKGGLSLRAIGEHFGGRDHSTIIYSVGVVQDLMDTDKSFKAKVEEIAELLKN